MEGTRLLFEKLGFNFNKSIKAKPIVLENNESLNSKICNHTYFYQNSSQTNTAFYLIDIVLSNEELTQVRSYIWNEYKADLLFCEIENKSNEIYLFYTKFSPKVTNEVCKIANFNTILEDEAKLESIRSWQFDSGAFWLNYHEFLKKATHKSIDKELVFTLKNLKESLEEQLIDKIPDALPRKEIVQALIDRTLYIKYLEDNHIINSHFYKHYFNNEDYNFKYLLRDCKPELLNKLYSLIHSIFNNSLFDNPTIEAEYLNNDICGLIHSSLNSDVKSGQLRLFDFKFNLIPVEFISYIYEVFLTDKQQKEGIFYTPKKLAQLILDDVIPDNNLGSVMDPSCGSGMFLIVAFQKLLEQSQEYKLQNIEERVELRTKLLSENIFGIEKQAIARRFTVFSLSLQLFRGLPPDSIKEYISKRINQNEEVNLFGTLNLFNNVLCGNSLSQNEIPFYNKTFDFIVGNPPFGKISQADEEMGFLESYNTKEESLSANKIVGKHQISQCFFLKVKDWSHKNTRFGFVSNSSNFYNTNTSNSISKFQHYFFSHYNIEKLYELSRVKQILFENASEDVVSLVFTNKIRSENIIKYYPVKMGVFSKNPFGLLIINEDEIIKISQNKLIDKELILRDFLSGNTGDRNIVNQLKTLKKLHEFILPSIRGGKYIHRGVQLAGAKKIIEFYGLTNSHWEQLSKKDKDKFYTKYKSEFTSKIKNSNHNTPYIKKDEIDSYTVHSHSLYIGNLDMANRSGSSTPDIYFGARILLSRVGSSIKAVHITDPMVTDGELYTIKLIDNKIYSIIEAILNSSLINYFVIQSLKKRHGSSFPKIGSSEIKKIPIPDLDDPNNTIVIKKIKSLSAKLHSRKIKLVNNLKNEMNDLIFELYDLNYLNKKRVEDYFLPKKKLSQSLHELSNYVETLLDTIQIFIQNDILVTKTNTAFGLVVVKVDLGNKDEFPEATKVKNYILNEIFEINPNENFLASRERIYGKNCVYIIRNNFNISWTETKAYEDGQDILKKIRHNE